MNKMELKRNICALVTGLMLVLPAGLTQVLAQEEDEDIFELSPFVITSGEDVGYAAVNTLAGSRLKTPLRDLAGSISVVTEEFLEDTSSTNTEDLFLYTVSTEASGPDGNFGNNGADRRSPTGSTRVRGLTAPDRTRSYFLSDIGLDTYNTDRVTIAKGPNAILFGLGSPAGIVNNNLKQAIFEERNEIKLRLGSWGAHREILDVNRVIFEDFLALRVIGLNNQNRFKQKPSFEDEQRLYATLTAKLTPTTVIRANVEVGSRNASRPPIITPTSNIPDWIKNGMPLAMDPVSSPGFSNYGGNRAPQFYYDSPTATTTSVGFDPQPAESGPDRRLRSMYTWANREDAAADVSNAVLADDDLYVFDFRNNTLAGRDNTQYNSFEAFNATLEQTWLEGMAGVELVLDEQSARWGSMDRVGNNVNVDASAFFPYFLEVTDDGTPINVPNPNAGRPYVTMTENFNHRISEREAWRLTAFYDLDFRDSENYGWLGRHIFTGLLTNQARDVTVWRTQYGSAIAGEGEDILESNRNRDFTSSSWDRRARGSRYLGPRISGVPSSGNLAQRVSVDTPRLLEYTSVFLDKGAEPLFDGHNGAYRAVTFPLLIDPINSASIDRQEIDSAALTAQSYFWNDHIVATYGWRQDEANAYRDDTPVRTTDNVVDVDTLSLPSSPGNTAKDEIFTYGIVTHLPRDWFKWLGGTGFSFHYSSSENFVPSPGRITVLGEPHPSPRGETEEYGFSIEAPDNKFYVRFNWYETNSQNQTDGSLGGASIPNWERLFYNNARNSLQEKLPRDPSVPPEVFETWEPDDPRLWPNNLKWPELYILPPQGMIDTYWTPKSIDPGVGGTPSVSDSPNSNVTGISDVSSKGMEIEGVWNPTKNWTLAFNAAQSEVIKTNVLKSYLKYYNAREPEWVAMGDLVARPNTFMRENVQTIFERTRNIHWRRLLAQTEKEGALQPEIREWRFNVVTNYRFDDESALKGYAVGAAYRWQDDVAVGFRDRLAQGDEFGVADLANVAIVDVNSPLFGPSESNLDVWITHRRKIFDGKVDWRLQLNIRNALNNDDLIITSKSADDVPARIRIMNPINYRLTSTFLF